MKKILSFIFMSAILVACNSSETTKITTDSTGAANTPGVDNVNGNVPDTTASTKLNQPLPVDSSKMKDSAHH